MPKTYAIHATYPDGVTRRCHVTTDNIAAYVARQLAASLFPFESIATARCHDIFTCQH